MAVTSCTDGPVRRRGECLGLPRVPSRNQVPPRRAGFTLMELLAVCTIVVLLAALTISLANYSRLKAATGRTRAELAVIESACEAFKLDEGRYPTSSTYRTVSGYDYWGRYYETLNSSMLGSQLRTGGYVTAVGLTIRPTGAITPMPFCSNALNVGLWNRTNLLDVVSDPWENPYNYYCTYPRITAASTLQLISSCTYPISTNAGATNITSTATTNTCVIGAQLNAGYDLWSYGPNRANDEGRNDDLANFQ